MINADGSVAFTAPDHVGASGVVTLPERTGLTPAASWGGTIELGLVLATLAGLVAACICGRMARRTSTKERS